MVQRTPLWEKIITIKKFNKCSFICKKQKKIISYDERENPLLTLCLNHPVYEKGLQNCFDLKFDAISSEIYPRNWQKGVMSIFLKTVFVLTKIFMIWTIGVITLHAHILMSLVKFSWRLNSYNFSTFLYSQVESFNEIHTKIWLLLYASN